MHIVSTQAVAHALIILTATSLCIDAFSVTQPLFSAVQRHASLDTRGSFRDVSFSLNVFFPRDGNHHSEGDNNGDYGDEDDDEDDSQSRFDVEKARERLEALVGDNEEFFSSKMQTVERPTVRSPTYQPAPLPALDVVLPPAPPLTTIERERREAEMQLLSQLTEGDDSVTDLWTLWFSERGGDAAQKLVKAEELTSEGPTGWRQAEDILRGLIEDHGVYWVEPVNRLATLFYMEGRLDEAETLCQIVLAVKPWHFGALSSIVMIYAAQANSEKARQWATSRLPTFAPTGTNRRRVAWAEKAVQSAQESLENAEKRVHELFGAPDDYSAQPEQENTWDEDAWQ